jgi:membrane dipeptidase
MHSHFLINGHYLRRDFFGHFTPPKKYNPLNNYMNYDRVKAGGLNTITFTVYVPWSPLFWVPRSEVAIEMIRTFNRIVRNSQGRMEQAVTADDVRRIVGEGRIAAILGAEGGHILDGNLANLKIFRRAGMRILTLTHFVTNDLADSCYGPKYPHDGLSDLGVEAVREMNRLGILVDISHCSDRAAMQAIELSQAPVVASHSGMRALCASPRNMPDDQLKAIAATGGMVGIILWPPLLKKHTLKASIETWADHVVHAAKLVGAQHVGIGTDMDGYTWPPKGFKDASDYRLIPEILQRRGFTDQEIDLILGENYLRLLKAAEEVAEQ